MTGDLEVALGLREGDAVDRGGGVMVGGDLVWVFLRGRFSLYIGTYWLSVAFP